MNYVVRSAINFKRLPTVALAPIWLFIVIASASASAKQEELQQRGLSTTIAEEVNLKGAVAVFVDIDGVLAPFSQDYEQTDAPTTDTKDASSIELHNCNRELTDEAMGALSKILKSIPKEKRRFILSSYWRVHHDCRQRILDSFEAYSVNHGGPLGDFKLFHGRTEHVHHCDCRQREIATWLEDHNPQGKVLDAYIVLDDQDVVHGRENRPYRDLLKGHAVKINGYEGLTLEDAALAISLINEQLDEA